MKEIKIEAVFKVYDSMSELGEDDRHLMEKAIEQLDVAYAPYSNFHVGAAVRLANDHIHLGCNQENASYPLCICGERVALFGAGANEPNVPVKKIAIVARNPAKPLESPVPPCGSCRQVINEYEHRHNQPILLLLKGDGPGIYEVMASDLLPINFNTSYLK